MAKKKGIKTQENAEKDKIISKKQIKIQKNVDLVNALATHIASVMDYGQKTKLTPLSKDIILQSGKHPHIYTVKSKLEEGSIWKDVLQSVKFTWKINKKGEKELVEIEKLMPDKNAEFIRKEVRLRLTTLENRLDSIEDQIKNLKK